MAAQLQLKRALRFFGRGLVAFTLSIMTIGLRRLHNIAFLGGLLGIIVSAWVLHKLYYYGSECAPSPLAIWLSPRPSARVIRRALARSKTTSHAPPPPP